jgi:hypothetical protein
MIKYLCTLLFALTFWPVSSVAQGSVSVNVGGGEHIQAPVPDGYGALGSSDPGFRDYMERTQAPRHRFLEAFLTPSDFAAARSGHSPSRERMVSLDLVEGRGGDLWTEEDFKKAVGSIRSTNQATTEGVTEASRKFFSSIAKLGTGVIAAKSPQFLGLIIDQPRAVGVMEGMAIEKTNAVDKVVLVQVYLYVKGRTLTLNVDATFHSQKDVDWARQTAIECATKLLSLNSR